MPQESTTPELEEAVRRSAEAFDRRDFDGILAIFGPDTVLDASPMGGWAFEGRNAIRGFWEDWRGPYEEFEQVIEEFRDLGNGVTFDVILQRARPLGSSGFVEFRYAGVDAWMDGLIERVTAYLDIDEARAAAERLAEERGYAVSQERS
jgi:ketosteroid isomerase-like protein